jgi:hypothetical protein
MPISTSDDRSTLNGPAGQSHAFQDWRSISKTIERIAEVLGALSRHVKSESGKPARDLVLQLTQWTNKLRPWLIAQGEIFNAVTSTSGEDVWIGSRSYDSAHHAAYCEARSFLRRFGFKLHPKYGMDDTFDPSIIIKDWDRARNAIHRFLPESWQEHFIVVRARIRRERAALEWAVSHQIVQVSPPNLRRKRIFEMWTKSHQARQEEARNRQRKRANAKLNKLHRERQAAARSLNGTPNQRGASIKSAIQQPMADVGVVLAPGSDSTKKIKPTPETLKIIRLIQRRWGSEQINEATGKTIENVRQIRCRLKKGKYAL